MSTQVKEKSPGKHASFVEAQLARAQSRIRLVDLTTALLGFLAGTLAYAVAMIVLDRLFFLSGATRQVGLLLYLVAAVVYFALAVVRPLLWRVNPFYAARQIEQTLPGSRNHVINWIDLRGQKLPAVIKSTLGQRAARDLSRTDVERAISGSRALVAGGAAGLFVVVLVVLFFLLGPAPFGSYLGRAFSPFAEGAVATRTQVSILRPEGGNAVVTIGNPVTIVAQVTGRIPGARDRDAPCLLYRHDPAEPYTRRYLQHEESGQQWATTIAPTDVRTGFWYRVTAGDAETPEYHVQARAQPLIADFLATYRHRPYTRRADRTDTRRKLEDLRGTNVTLQAVTNRTVAEGQLELDTGDGNLRLVRGERLPDDPRAIRFRFDLDRGGKYRIRFTSSEGEAYLDPAAHEVIVLPDNAPQVRITQPAKDVDLPADGHLEIHGEAADDIGLARLSLCLEADGGKIKFRSRPYLADKLGKPGFGTPRRLDYLHLLELPTLVDEQGKAVRLAPGTVVEYWLEAADACDFPAPNVTQSAPRYKITIVEGKQDEQQKKEAEAARKKQREEEQKQAAQAARENAEREAQRQKEEAQEKAEQARREEQKKKDEGGNGGEANQPNPEQAQKDDRARQEAEQLKELLDRKKQGEDRGEGGKEGDGSGGEGAQGRDGKGKDAGGQNGKAGEGNRDNDSKAPSSSKEPGKPGTKPGQSKEPPRGEGGRETGERKPDKPASPEEVREGTGKPRNTEGLSVGESKPGQKDEATPGEGKPGEGKGPGKNGGDAKEPGKAGGERDRPGTAQPPREANGKAGSAPSEGKKGSANQRGATPSDVEQAAKDLQSNDPQRRRKAARDLQDMKEQAQDAATRDAAGKALDQAKKEGRLDQDGGDGQAGRKDKGKEGGAGKDRGKGRDPKKGPGDGTSDSEKGRQDNPTGSNPGAGGDRPRTNPGNGGTSREPPKRGDRPEKHRASMLQLEEFRKSVDRDILQKAKMSPEQFERFLRDYADLVRRQRDLDEPEKLPGPSRGGKLPAAGGRAIERKDGKAGDLHNQGRPKPPPGYRESYQDFLKLVR